MMPRVRVTVAPRAVAQVEAIAACWRVNRPTSLDLFLDEFAAALTRLASAPSAGSSVSTGATA